MITSSVADGVSLGPGRCALVVQPSDPDATETEFASIVLNVEGGEVRSAVRPGFIVSCLAEYAGAIVLIGRLGEVALLRADQLTNEAIVGPEDFGFLTDARTVGDWLYVVGMRRQVFVRSGAGWSRADAGVLDDSNDVDRVTGFRAVDGVAADDVYAVGLDGEIWHLHRRGWRQPDSPTNAILEQVRCTPHGDVYAVGQAGVIVRGAGEAWTVIEQGETQEDFWGLEWFRGRLYLATGSQLFRLEESESVLQSLVADGSSFARLRAGHGALWSFGADEVRWTADGESWNEIVVPKADSRA